MQTPHAEQPSKASERATGIANGKQETPPEPPLALSVKSFCLRMSISPSTFWKLCRKDEIRVIRLGNRTLIPASEIARLLGEGEAA